MSLWKPYEKSDGNGEINFEASTSKQKRLRVGEKEKEIIMNSYFKNGEQWQNVLQDTKSRV